MYENQAERAMVRSSSATVGFMLGAVIGAGLALLLAPQPGSETRRKMGDTMKGWKKHVNNGVEKAREGIDQAKEIKSAAQSAVESGRDAYNRAREGQADASARRS